MTTAQIQAAIYFKNSTSLDDLRSEIAMEERMLERMKFQKVTNHDGSIHSEQNQIDFIAYLKDCLNEYKDILLFVK